jgi:hypothetical protein
MKKILFLLFFIPMCAFSQVNEPEFIGEINIVYPDGSYKLLEKQPARLTSQADVGIFIAGIGSIRGNYVIEEGSSYVRMDNGRDVTLIVKSADNNYDPVSTIGIFKFKSYSHERKAEISSINIFGDDQYYKFNALKYSAQKYGNNCYKITLNNIEDGEYGVIQYNPKQDNNRILIISCFGIGKEKGK